MAFNCQILVGVVFLYGGTILNFIASWGVYWKSLEVGTLFIYKGLYTICVDYPGITKCDSIEEPKGYEHGSRFLVGTSMVMSAISSILSFVHLFKVYRRTASKAMLSIMVGLCIASVTFLVITSIVYGSKFQNDEKHEDEWELDSTFFVNIVAAVGLLVAAILLQLSYNPEQVQPQAGAVMIQTYPAAYPGQPMPPPSGYPPPAYGQPAPYGQPVYYSQPQPYATAASGQPLPPGYPQSSSQPQPYPIQPGMGPNYNTQYNDKNTQPQPQPPPLSDPSYPPPPPAQY